MAGRLNFEKCSHSKSLFKQDDGSCIVFYMRPCEEREKLRPVIEHGGGKITSKCLQGSMKLAEKGAVITTDDYLAAKYVEDCVQQNKLLDTRTYKLKKGKYPSSSKKQKNGSVDDGMEPANVIKPALYTKSRSTNSKGTEGRNMYTLEDDMAMLNYIVTEVKYNETGGYQAFRDMQVEKVTKHSFMSMHTRFRKQILPNIDKYDIPNRWKYLVTGDSKYNNKHHQTGLDALFKSMEKPQNQTGSSKKKDLFSHSKLPVQLTDQSENQFPQKGSNSPQTKYSSPQKIVTLDEKETSTDESNPTTSTAKRSELIKDNSEEADKVTDMENQKKNKSSKQNTNSVSSADTPKKSRKRMLFNAVEAVYFPDQTKQAEDQQVGNTMGKDTDKNLTVCKKKFPRKSVLSSSKAIPMHTKYTKNGDKHKNQLENSVDVGDREKKVLDSDIESFATADNAEITVDDSEDDASFITCEDEFDRHLLQKLERSNKKSGTGSDLKTQNTHMKDFRRKIANNLNHGSNEQTGNDSNSNKGKSPIKRKSDSVEQLESSDEESVKINRWRKFAPSKQKKTTADPFMSVDSSEPEESETADDHNSMDAKNSNIESRKPQKGKSGGGQNRFVDYSSMDSDIVEDSVEEEEEEEVAQEVRASRSGRGKKRSAQNPPPYLEQILDTDVESQTDDLTQNPAADHTAEIYNFEEDDKNAAQVEEVGRFLQRMAEQFSLEKSEVFKILLSCNGDTRRAVNWMRFGDDSIYLPPWKPSDDKKLMAGEDIVRLELVYGKEEVKKRALYLEILESH